MHSGFCQKQTRQVIFCIPSTLTIFVHHKKAMRDNGSHFIFLFLLCGCLASCRHEAVDADRHAYSQDFDNLKMWTRGAAVTDEQAHSGKYSAYTDENREFSQTFEMSFDYARSKGYSGASVSAWCMMADFDCKAALVASIESPEGNHPVYLATPLTDFLKMPMAWGRYKTFLKFPAVVPPECKIKVYLSSPQRQKAWMDDVIIQFHR
jgi:hypothetical protein